MPASLSSAQDVLSTNPVAHPRTLQASLGGRVIPGGPSLWLLSDAKLIPVGLGQARESDPGLRQEVGSPRQANQLATTQQPNPKSLNDSLRTPCGRSARFALAQLRRDDGQKCNDKIAPSPQPSPQRRERAKPTVTFHPTSLLAHRHRRRRIPRIRPPRLVRLRPHGQHQRGAIGDIGMTEPRFVPRLAVERGRLDVHVPR